MRERFQIPAVLFGALLLYAALTTLLPSLVFRTPFDVDPVEQEPAGEARPHRWRRPKHCRQHRLPSAERDWRAVAPIVHGR